MLAALLLPLLGQSNAPAFLDSPTQIRMAVAADSSDFRVMVGGREAAIEMVEPTEFSFGPNEPATPETVVLPGSMQGALGAAEWDPNGDSTKMTRVAEGRYELVVNLPAGNFEFKVARGGSWAQNWGDGFRPDGANIKLTLPPPGRKVRFVVDFGRKLILNSIQNPDQVPAPTASDQARVRSSQRRPSSLEIRLARPLSQAELLSPISVFSRGASRPVYLRRVLDRPEFVYLKTDLGPNYSRKSTVFKVWSPVSSSAVILFANGQRRLPMKRGSNGVWFAEVKGDLHGAAYQYEFQSYGQTRRAADIYAQAADAKSVWSLVVDQTRLNPPGWGAMPRPKPRAQTDSILYEIHIRDFTVDASSGVKPEWRGKYLGLTQSGTRQKDKPTGLDYLQWLGVTDVHLLPFQNFNPDHSQNYNWGYETTLFNVPEEQYSTRPSDPLATIRETKLMVQAMHQKGLRVIQDVVYNHTVPTHGERSAFDQTVPYYWFRTNDAGQLLNESGVGNALRDEAPMARKYVRESLLMWLREYRLDGFRFDLIGMFTPESVKDWTIAVRKERPDATIYGEPWTGGGPTRFGKGAQRGTEMAVFNDDFRNALRGQLDGPAPGFAMGAGSADAVKSGVMGSLDTFVQEPIEVVNYVSAHDNLTLRDKIDLAMPEASGEMKERSVRLATAAVLLSQGVPFLEGGPEIGRTKGANHNSYNAGDGANRYDWAGMDRAWATALVTRELIALRRATPALRLSRASEVRRRLKFVPAPNSTVAWTLDDRLLVVLHGGQRDGSMTLPPGRWTRILSTEAPGMRGSASGSVMLPALTAQVFRRA